MKKILTMVAVLLSGLVSSFGFEPVATNISLGNWDIHPNIYARALVGTEAVHDSKNAWVTDVRETVVANQKNGPMFYEAQVNFINIDQKYQNSLYFLDVGMKLGEEMNLRLGRIFDAAGYVLPDQPNLNTHDWEREPWGFYSYGLQFELHTTNVWFLTDVGGASDKSFDEAGNFDRLELSQFLLWKASDKISVGYVFQMSDDLRKEGLLAVLNPIKDLTVSYEAYTVQGDQKYSGHFILASYEVCKTIELHTGVDQQFHNNTADILRAGIMYKMPTDRIRIIVDYDKYVGDEEKSGFYGAFQLWF